MVLNARKREAGTCIPSAQVQPDGCPERLWVPGGAQGQAGWSLDQSWAGQGWSCLWQGWNWKDFKNLSYPTILWSYEEPCLALRAIAHIPQDRMGSIHWWEIRPTHNAICRPFAANVLPINNSPVGTASHQLHTTARRGFQLTPKLCDWLGSLASILLAVGQDLKKSECSLCSWMKLSNNRMGSVLEDNALQPIKQFCSSINFHTCRDVLVRTPGNTAQGNRIAKQVS